MSEVRDDPAASRYEIETPAGLAFAAYEREGDLMVFTHTVVPEAARGSGTGSRLIEGAVADVRRRGLRIVPQCPFVAAWLEQHPQEKDLVAD